MISVQWRERNFFLFRRSVTIIRRLLISIVKPKAKFSIRISEIGQLLFKQLITGDYLLSPNAINSIFTLLYLLAIQHARAL